MRRTALFSLNETTHSEKFAKQLIKSGWDIIASRRTCEFLKKKGILVQNIVDFTDVKEDYGFSPTLHAKVEYALTNPKAQPRIDLVYVLPYPLSIGNDVGGRTLLALAVKGQRIPVMSIDDMKLVVSEISKNDKLSESLRIELADKACFEITKHYSSLISDNTKHDFIAGSFSYQLRSGENPYQVPASIFSFENSDPLALTNFEHISGVKPSFTNIADADCLIHSLSLTAEAFKLNTGHIPYICVTAKHGNACGLGISTKLPNEAIEKALFGNPRSAWGGEVITNFPINEKNAQILFKSNRREKLIGDGHWMLDLIIAPSFTPDAISILNKRQSRKLLQNKSLQSPSIKKSGYVYRTIRGGFLRQPPANYILNLKNCEVSGKKLSADEISTLIIAWTVAFTSNHGGNEVALAKNNALLSAGGGPSTYEAAKVAITRAIDNGHDIKNAVFAADAFFPFTDVPAMLCKAGVKIGSVPLGAKRDEDIKTFFRKQKITVCYIPKEFRGFCRH